MAEGERSTATELFPDEYIEQQRPEGEFPISFLTKASHQNPTSAESQILDSLELALSGDSKNTSVINMLIKAEKDFSKNLIFFRLLLKVGPAVAP